MHSGCFGNLGAGGGVGTSEVKALDFKLKGFFILGFG